MRPGKKRFQRAELFRDHQRRVIRQHDSARTDADGFGISRHVADQHGSRRAGDAGHVVMFRQPKSLVAPLLRVLRERERVTKTFRNRSAFANGREVENGKRNVGIWLHQLARKNG